MVTIITGYWKVFPTSTCISFVSTFLYNAVSLTTSASDVGCLRQTFLDVACCMSVSYVLKLTRGMFVDPSLVKHYDLWTGSMVEIT